MEWSATSATKAYLDTLKLCNNHIRQRDSWRTLEPGSTEFVSALAAGVRAKLIVEVTSSVSPSTVGLAAAARHTGGRLVCILPEPVLAESRQVISDSGLKDLVEFRTEDPSKLLPSYEKVDFSLIDCKDEGYAGLLGLVHVNPVRSVIVANNLTDDEKGLRGHVGGVEEKVEVRSLKHLIGKGMEVTMISRNREKESEKRKACGERFDGGSGRTESKKRNSKSRWVFKVDEDSGEEHIFRVPKSCE